MGVVLGGRCDRRGGWPGACGAPVGDRRVRESSGQERPDRRPAVGGSVADGSTPRGVDRTGRGTRTAYGCRKLGRRRYVVLEPAYITVGADAAALASSSWTAADGSIARCSGITASDIAQQWPRCATVKRGVGYRSQRGGVPTRRLPTVPSPAVSEALGSDHVEQRETARPSYGYPTPWTTEPQRQAAYRGFVHFCNQHRPHGALNWSAPAATHPASQGTTSPASTGVARRSPTSGASEVYDFVNLRFDEAEPSAGIASAILALPVRDRVAGGDHQPLSRTATPSRAAPRAHRRGLRLVQTSSLGSAVGTPPPDRR